MFSTDLGDLEREGEWSLGSTEGGDSSGDDDVDVLIRATGEVVVDYRGE